MIDKKEYIDIKNSIIGYGKEFASDEEINNFSKHIESKLDSFKPTMMIYGVYNAGKSTLLNAIFGKEEYAKTGDAPETKEVGTYEYNGYTIFDTPGLNAKDEDDATTNEQFRKSEVILFVMSSDGSFEEEYVYNTISEIVKAKKPAIIVLNNKSGIDPDSKEAINMMEKVSQNLLKIGDRKNIDKIEEKVEICLVNAQSALKAKINNENILLEKSNILTLEYMIDKYLKRSGEDDIANTLNMYIKNFVLNLLSKIDNKIDNAQAQKLEELITYVETLKEETSVRSRNVIDTHMERLTDELYDMIFSGDDDGDSIKSHVEQTVGYIRDEIFAIENDINSKLSTKTDGFKEEFEKLSVDTDCNVDSMSREVAEYTGEQKDNTKDIFKTLATLPAVVIATPGPWYIKAAATIPAVIGAILEALGSDDNNNHEAMIQQQRKQAMAARSNANKITNNVKNSLYKQTTDLIKDKFDDKIAELREEASKLSRDNSHLLESKSSLTSVANRL